MNISGMPIILNDVGDMMRIAITGATGMIGTELINVALDEGHEIIAIVRPNSSRINNLKKSNRITVVYSDITQYNQIDCEEKCDLFIHLAWKETFGSERDNVFVQTENIQYALDAVMLAARWGAKAFVGAGSQAEYGVSNQILNSTTPVNPESGYGVAKYTAGKLCKILCKQKGIKFNWGRITSTYGELDADYTLIKYTIRTLLNGESPELTRCEQIWDYTYSKDMAKALLLIGIKGVDGKAYSLGSGEHRSLKDYILTIRDKIDPSIPIKFGEKPYYDHQPMLLFPDVSELSKDTGYKPEYVFEEGIQKVIDYMKSNNK